MDAAFNMEFLAGKRKVRPEAAWTEEAEPLDFDIPVYSKVSEVTYKPRITWSSAYGIVTSKVHVDGREVVDWMLDAAALNVVVSQAADEYGRSGGYLQTGSGDAYIPGVYVEGARFLSVPARTVEARGKATFCDEDKCFDVPVAKRGWSTRSFTIALPALVRKRWVQWLGLLARFKRLLSLPFRGQLGIPVVKTDEGYATFPPMIFQYASKTPIIKRFLLEVSYQVPAPLKVIFLSGPGSPVGTVEIPAPDSQGTYMILLRSYQAPMTGYMAFASDGVSTGPVILRVQTIP